MRRELEAPHDSLSARDLLAMLRGAAGIGDRAAALRALLGSAATADYAIEVAFLQDDPVLRVMAVRAIRSDAAGFAAALEVGLADADARVRGASARRLDELPDDIRAVDLAREALGAEEDGYAFRALHEALAARLGPLVSLPAGGEMDPVTRRVTRAAWRRPCPE
jgi:hypothetical protein